MISRAECCELCDYVAAWCAEAGIELRDANQWIDPETGEIMRPDVAPKIIINMP